tara:strand:- start:1536 stop:2285 length:750 start_codon:yes stop_codon:yes gene_type:complete
MKPRLTIARNSCKPVPLTLSRIIDHKNPVTDNNRNDVINEVYNNILNIINRSFVKNEGDIVKSYQDWKLINSSTLEYNDANLFLWNINPIESLDNDLDRETSYCTMVSITRNNTIEASLIYNIKDDIYISAIRGEGAMIENEKLRSSNSTSSIAKFICDNDLISDNIVKMNHYQRDNSESIVKDTLKLINGEIDFILINNFDFIRYQALYLICREASLLVDLRKINDDEKWVFLASKAKIFNSVLHLIR